jgi:hypothetical protein
VGANVAIEDVIPVCCPAAGGLVSHALEGLLLGEPLPALHRLTVRRLAVGQEVRELFEQVMVVCE